MLIVCKSLNGLSYQLLWYDNICVQVTLIFLGNDPKVQELMMLTILSGCITVIVLFQASMVPHTCNPGIQGAEAGESL